MVRLSLSHLVLTVHSFTVVQVCAFQQATWPRHNLPSTTTTVKTTKAFQLTKFEDDTGESSASATSSSSRRDFLGVSLFGMPATAVALTGTTASIGGILLGTPPPAHAVGPVKINLLKPIYTAAPCPKDRPIPGEKAMKGMRGLCVTVNADLEESPAKDLDKVGVYGFVTGKESGESVLANNPDLSTDAGQFAMIEEIKTTDKKIQFEFIAAIPQELVRVCQVQCLGP
jgi:hypothetical protein